MHPSGSPDLRQELRRQDTRVVAVRVRRVVTTRAGGASRAPFERFNLSVGVGDDPAAVAANRPRLAAGVGLPVTSVVWMRQVHGTATATVSAPPEQDLAEVDAMVTNRPQLALAVLAADCVPVLLADPEAGVLGAVHAGRVDRKSTRLNSSHT